MKRAVTIRIVDKESVGRRLQQARKAKGLSRDQVRRRLGKSLANVQHHEGGRNAPGPSTLAFYAKIYTVSTDWILTGIGKGPTGEADPYAELHEVWDRLTSEQQEHSLASMKLHLKRKSA